jgi:ectoine hydroxylase
MPNRTPVEEYLDEGFAVIPDGFSAGEVALLRRETERLALEDVPSRVVEKDLATVRALHGCHAASDLMSRLVRLPRLAQLARDIIGDDIYVYQFKINMKAAFSGDIWAWHQDYIYWRNEDGMPECRCVNVAIFLDDAMECNGPLMVIPKSHGHGVMMPADADAESPEEWSRDVSADLKYTLSTSTVESLVAKGGGIRLLTGKAGTVVAFHPNLAHASLPNISPFARRMLIVTYNSVANAPAHVVRPEFLVTRAADPIRIAPDDVLV